ncbi:MAG: hypothetical protein DRQ54_06995 [Gammaproteobacteria bacterium]|nr:MAG: hypothetical protein DRQ54_06995 [Gammaproteobacteria bacterium]RLA11625.1 MAG: hypothetical protein DRQ52_09285 [Gammaproteobacteria bacterium]
MAGVRVVVTINFPNGEVADQAVAGMVEANAPIREREGAVQYEVLRSAENPGKVVLMEHWASRELYDKHWTKQMAGGPPDLDPSWEPSIEFYNYQEYAIDDDGVWIAADPADRNSTIRWK